MKIISFKNELEGFFFRNLHSGFHIFGICFWKRIFVYSLSSMMVRFIFTYFLSTTCFIYALGQDTTYFKGVNESTKDRKSASHYGIMNYDKTDNLRAVYTEYFISGDLKKHIPYSNYKEKIIDGKTQIWREKGILKEEISYKNDKYHGEYKTYWKNGKLKRNDLYENDSLISGICYDTSGNKVPYFKIESDPEFPGGLDSLYSFLKRNMNYPDLAKKKWCPGKSLCAIYYRQGRKRHRCASFERNRKRL